MKVRKVVTVSAIAIALASGPAIGVAQADPNPPPSPGPAPAPVWNKDAKDTKAHVKVIEEHARQVIEDARRAQGPFWF